MTETGQAIQRIAGKVGRLTQRVEQYEQIIRDLNEALAVIANCLEAALIESSKARASVPEPLCQGRTWKVEE